MSVCLNCGHEQTMHLYDGCSADYPCWCTGFRDEPTDSEMSRGHRPVDSFEGVGDFNSSDPLERWQAHNAAKGR